MEEIDGVRINTEDSDLIRRCLTLVSRIAARGACSPNLLHVADTLAELRIALVDPKREEHPFHASGDELDKIHHELDFIDSTSEEFTAFQVLRYAVRATWN